MEGRELVAKDRERTPTGQSAMPLAGRVAAGETVAMNAARRRGVIESWGQW